MNTAPQRTDAVISLRLRTEAEGGRRTDVVGRDYRPAAHIPGHIDSDWGVLIYPMGKTLQLGHTYEVPVAFIVPEEVFKRLRVGDAFEVREGFRVVGDASLVAWNFQGA